MGAGAGEGVPSGGKEGVLKEEVLEDKKRKFLEERSGVDKVDGGES